MPQQRALVFIAVHKDKFSAEAPTSSVKRYRHEEQDGRLFCSVGP